jgi:hypothetical protein
LTGVEVAMMNPPTRRAVSILAFATAFAFAASARAENPLSIQLEGGAAWQARNDFAVPGDTGTLVRLPQGGASSAFRASLYWDVGQRFSLRFVAAPLSTATDFVPASPVLFQGVTFQPSERVTTDYRFDTYRVTGYWRFAPSAAWRLRAGATLLVRDAAIGLSSATTHAEKTNTGAVPLLYGAARWQATPGFALEAEADAAAAPQGRAIDASLKGAWTVSPRTELQLGLRALDGGADNDEVVSFATFYYAVAGVAFRF